MTEYNNKTYRVDDVRYDLRPDSTFDKKSGGSITFIQYYKQVRSGHSLIVRNMLRISKSSCSVVMPTL